RGSLRMSSALTPAAAAPVAAAARRGGPLLLERSRRASRFSTSGSSKPPYMVESGCTRDNAGTLQNLRTSRASPIEAEDAGCNRIATADCRDVMDLAPKSGGHV